MLEFPLLCRLCGSKTENGLYIYCDEGKRRQVETKIRLYLHFQVLPSDSLPKKICTSCFEELESMHRFAINALKVQDHLSRLSKELPLTAINTCKTFMSSYVHEPVMVNETIASLTNQEVTEMEVQVDPMVFLEDDQIDGQETEGENGAAETPVGNGETLGQSSQGENPNFKSAIIKSPECTVQTAALINMKDEISSDIKPNEMITASCNDQNSSLIKSEEKEEQSPGNCLPNPPSDEKGSQQTTEQNGSIIEPQEKTEIPSEESLFSSSATLKKGKKVTPVLRNIKTSKSTVTDGMKCTTYTCPICKKVYMKRGLFKAHLEIHTKDNKYACEICLRVFKKEINLLRHRKSHLELSTFPCAHCNRVYPTKSTLRSHLVSHSDERPHVCNICSKSFKRNQDLKFHLNQHNGLRPYRCPYCTKSFASSGNCFSHRRRAHLQEVERDRAALRKIAAATAE